MTNPQRQVRCREFDLVLDNSDKNTPPTMSRMSATLAGASVDFSLLMEFISGAKTIVQIYLRQRQLQLPPGIGENPFI